MSDANAIAREFSRLLTQYLGKGTMQQIIRINAKPENSPYCASHNYCDSNIFMWEAVCNHLGLDPDREDITLNEHIDLMNQAWDIAKENRFYI